MIASTMPLLTIHHKTEYRYAHPVAFGEHRIMLRPRAGHDLRVLANILEIVPEPMSLRWIHDVFGNSVAIATFDERAETLSFVNTATVQHDPAEEFALTPDDPAYFYPVLYDDEEFLDLVQFITPQYGDPQGEMSAWARNFLDAEGPTPTFHILSNMTHGIREAFSYRKRHEQGTQHPLDTLQTRSGTCRDYALFMIEALRRLDHEQRIVAAGAGPGLQGVERMLGALLVPLAVAEGLADAVSHVAQDMEGRGRPFRIEKIPRPRRHLALGIAILRRDELHEVGKLLVVVEKRIEIRRIVRGQRELLGRIVLDGRGVDERQGFGALVEGRDRDAVAEHVVDPAQRHRLRHNLENIRQHAQIMAVARTQHDAVFAERHRVRVAIFGLVMDGQERHRRSNHRDFVRSNLYRSLLNSKSACRFGRQRARKNGFGPVS